MHASWKHLGPTAANRSPRVLFQSFIHFSKFCSQAGEAKLQKKSQKYNSYFDKGICNENTFLFLLTKTIQIVYVRVSTYVVKNCQKHVYPLFQYTNLKWFQYTLPLPRYWWKDLTLHATGLLMTFCQFFLTFRRFQ